MNKIFIIIILTLICYPLMATGISNYMTWDNEANWRDRRNAKLYPSRIYRNFTDLDTQIFRFVNGDSTFVTITTDSDITIGGNGEITGYLDVGGTCAIGGTTTIEGQVTISDSLILGSTSETVTLYVYGDIVSYTLSSGTAGQLLEADTLTVNNHSTLNGAVVIGGNVTITGTIDGVDISDSIVRLDIEDTKTARFNVSDTINATVFVGDGFQITNIYGANVSDSFIRNYENDTLSGTLTVTGAILADSLTITNNIYSASITTSGNANITGNNLVTGYITGDSLTITDTIYSNEFWGNGYNLTNINLSNVTGTLTSSNIQDTYLFNSQEDTATRINIAEEFRVGTDSFVVTTNSRVGINKIPTTYALEVDGDIEASVFRGSGAGLTGLAGATGGIINDNSTTIASDSDANGVGSIGFQVASTEFMTIYQAGDTVPRVGVNQTTPTNTFEVNGTSLIDSLTVTQSVYANALIGDGSGITGVSASSINAPNISGLINLSDSTTGILDGDSVTFEDTTDIWNVLNDSNVLYKTSSISGDSITSGTVRGEYVSDSFVLNTSDVMSGTLRVQGNVTLEGNLTCTGVNAAISISGSNSTLGLKTGTTINEFSTDGTMAGNSDNAVPTEKALVTYMANQRRTAGEGLTDDGSDIDIALASTNNSLQIVGDELRTEAITVKSSAVSLDEAITDGSTLNTTASNLVDAINELSDSIVTTGNAPQYDSDWFAITKDLSYIKTHSLGIDLANDWYSAQVWIRASAGEPSRMAGILTSLNASNQAYATVLEQVTADTLLIVTGSSGIYIGADPISGSPQIVSGDCRVLIWTGQ